MKVLYLGVWKDGTGWGNAAQNCILALDSAGVDVVPRAISLTQAGPNVHVPERILELEQNDESGCDICIQHLLPEMMEYNGRFDLNIGRYDYETSHFRNTTWAEHLNLMDQVWVSNNDMIRSARQSYVYKPIAVVPHCFDVSKYSQHYKPYPIPELDGKFVFYTVGEINRRKNLAGLLKAFHLEFTPDEPVALLIKGNITGVSAAQANRTIRGITDEVKRGMRLYPKPSNYLNEIIVTQWLDDHDMMRLHKTGDCFVLPSYGEAWSIPGFEAMAMGNPTILTDEGGPADYIKNFHNGLLVPAQREPVFIRPEEVPVLDIWIGNEEWHSPNISKLRQYMRQVYSKPDERQELGTNGIDQAYNYSYEKIGQQMKALLQAKPSKFSQVNELEQKHSLAFAGK
jgi:glycosyltransferase involved in cell wall biosynthesis